MDFLLPITNGMFQSGIFFGMIEAFIVLMVISFALLCGLIVAANVAFICTLIGLGAWHGGKVLIAKML